MRNKNSCREYMYALPTAIFLADELSKRDPVFKDIWFDSIINASIERGKKISDLELEELSLKQLKRYKETTSSTSYQQR
jgi:hypothetical protein